MAHKLIINLILSLGLISQVALAASEAAVLKDDIAVPYDVKAEIKYVDADIDWKDSGVKSRSVPRHLFGDIYLAMSESSHTYYLRLEGDTLKVVATTFGYLLHCATGPEDIYLATFSEYDKEGTPLKTYFKAKIDFNNKTLVNLSSSKTEPSCVAPENEAKYKSLDKLKDTHRELVLAPGLVARSKSHLRATPENQTIHDRLLEIHIGQDSGKPIKIPNLPEDATDLSYSRLYHLMYKESLMFIEAISYSKKLWQTYYIINGRGTITPRRLPRLVPWEVAGALEFKEGYLQYTGNRPGQPFDKTTAVYIKSKKGGPLYRVRPLVVSRGAFKASKHQGFEMLTECIAAAEFNSKWNPEAEPILKTADLCKFLKDKENDH